MKQDLVATSDDRFLPRSSTSASVCSHRRLLAGAALGSLFMQSAVSLLGLGLFERPFEPAAASREIEIEVAIEPVLPTPASPSRQRPAEPTRSEKSVMPALEKVSSGGIEPSAAQPEHVRRPNPSTTSSFAQERVRAVLVPMPTERGDKGMRYDVAVVGSLERAKQFPEQALQRHARGTAVAGFALDDAGHVLGMALLRSSGDRELDVESLAVIRRAAPFPKPPPGAHRKFAVDISLGMGG